MLTVRNISKSYVQRGLVLDNLSVDVAEGDLISIMGPSGSGKTTLLNIIGLLDKPDRGTVYFRDSDISVFNSDESALYRNSNIGFVFQDHLLLPYLTVHENILLPLLAGNYTTEQLFARKEHIDILMDSTSIIDLKNKYPNQISGGEAQRVALVRALVNNPSILLADEPTGSLDSKNAAILGDLLVEINRDFGITVIIATHSTELSKKMARQLKLESGKLI